MDDDGNPILRQLHIQLNAIRPSLHCLAECQHGVFRVFAAVSAVGKIFRHFRTPSKLSTRQALPDADALASSSRLRRCRVTTAAAARMISAVGCA